MGEFRSSRQHSLFLQTLAKAREGRELAYEIDPGMKLARQICYREYLLRTMNITFTVLTTGTFSINGIPFKYDDKIAVIAEALK